MAKLIPDLDLAERVEAGMAALAKRRADDAERQRQLDAEHAERERLASLAHWQKRADELSERWQQWISEVAGLIERLDELAAERRVMDAEAGVIYRGSDAAGGTIGVPFTWADAELCQAARAIPQLWRAR